MGGRPIVWCQRSRGEKKNGGVSTMCFCAGVHGMVIHGAKKKACKEYKEGRHKYTGTQEQRRQRMHRTTHLAPKKY